ncbi:MAG TPA: helix-turn-helix domain-containing protein [Thermoanaerobaculia bacterium]|nr:helix-turn-helix domain-containing protein [Thermoanaerobaculia bacterium]
MTDCVASPEDLLTVSDVAGWLRLKPAAVRALARRSEIGFYRVGRAIRFQPGDVKAFLERQRRPARGERALRAAGL